MKRLIRSSEDIFGMARIGADSRNKFSVAVNPDRKRIGLCYLKYYNNVSYDKATKIARLNIRKPEYISHKTLGKINFKLNAKRVEKLMFIS